MNFIPQGFLPFLTIIQMGILGLLLFILNTILRSMVFSHAIFSKYRQYYPAGELLGLIFYAWFVTVLLVKEKSLFVIILALFFIMFGIWFGRYVIRDFLSGVILKWREPLLLHKELRIGDKNGRIQQAGYLSVVIQTDTADYFHIPYHKLMENGYCITHSHEKRNCFEVRLSIPHHKKMGDLLPLIQRTILLSPGIILQYEPHCIQEDHSQSFYTLTVTYYAINKYYASIIESNLLQIISEV